MKRLRGISAAGAVVAMLVPCAAVGQTVAKQATASTATPPPPFENFTAGTCAHAPRWIDHLATREIKDNTVYLPAKDTTSRLAADSVGVCANAFGGSTNEEWQFLNLGRMHLIRAIDAEARAMAQRYLRAVGTSVAEKRAWALHLIASDNADAQPARFTASREALTELDALGKPAAKARVQAHFAVAKAAQRHLNDSLAAAEASKAIAAWRLLDAKPGLLNAMPMALSFIMKAEIALRGSGPALGQAIIDTAEKTVPKNAGLARAMINTYVQLYPKLGKKGATIEAEFWYGTDGQSRPTAGRVTLISRAEHWCGARCTPQYDRIKRYGQRFGDRVDIINITKTLGFYSDTAPVTPAREALYDSTYFLGKKRLPGVLAVSDSKYEFIPDGRRRNKATPQDTNYPAASLVIVDKKGIVRYATTQWDRFINSEKLLEEQIAQFIELLIAER